MRRVCSRLTYGATFAAIVLVHSAVQAQSDARPVCRITVASPGDGTDVARRAEVRGTAVLPPGAELWVLVHRADLTNQWWPQGAASIDHAGRWNQTVEFGRARDIGHPFEIVALSVTAATHRVLRDWFVRAAEQDFPPVLFPSGVEGCAMVTVRVRKVSH